MERGFNLDAAVFTGLIDLASEKLGGVVLVANDDFFAEKENLIKAGRGVFIADKYTDRGKWMDGWETRRKRVPGHDWCIIKLGASGVISGVDIDTNHFLGNHPPYASIDAICQDEAVSDAQLEKAEWQEILPKVALKQGSQNVFPVSSERRWTHIRLNIFPDGGVARLKVYGTVDRNWHDVKPTELVDLAAVENGGLVVACNDMFFGNKNNMIMPGCAVNMGDGWETRRRRDVGNDWSVIKLARPGLVRKIEIDTNHYKGNFPDSCWIDGCYSPDDEIDTLNAPSREWKSILVQTKLTAHNQHYYEHELTAPDPVTHLRLSIAPDGGISRFRVWCTVVNATPTAAAAKDGSSQKVTGNLAKYM
jgi:allantoicase